MLVIAKRIFKDMPANKRRAVLNSIINVQGLKPTMTKQARAEAVKNFGRTNQGERNLLPILFEISVKQHLV